MGYMTCEHPSTIFDVVAEAWAEAGEGMGAGVTGEGAGFEGAGLKVLVDMARGEGPEDDLLFFYI
jgi:hypothetical protein